MKLLTPINAKAKRDDQDMVGILRTQELKKAEQEARIGLANAEADFNDTLARNRTKWATEEEEHAKRLIEMQGEVNRLEAKRLNALIPVRILEQTAEEKLKEAEEFMANLTTREDYAEEITEKAQDMLDELGHKELELVDKEKKLNFREADLKQQSMNADAQTQAANLASHEFITHRTNVEKDLASRQAAIILYEQDLKEREEELATAKQQLADEQARLTDERSVLERAWRELDRKKALNIPL